MRRRKSTETPAGTARAENPCSDSSRGATEVDAVPAERGVDFWSEYKMNNISYPAS